METNLNGTKKSASSKKVNPKRSGKKAAPAENTSEPIQKVSTPLNDSSRNALTTTTYNGKELPIGSFLTTFKYKQFARHYAMTGNMREAYKLTFGNDPELAKLIGQAEHILKQPEVQIELQRLMPTDEKVYGVLSAGLDAPVDPVQSWSDKHKFMTTALQLKGHLKKDDDGSRTQNNIIMVVEEVVKE